MHHLFIRLIFLIPFFINQFTILILTFSPINVICKFLLERLRDVKQKKSEQLDSRQSCLKQGKSASKDPRNNYLDRRHTGVSRTLKCQFNVLIVPLDQLPEK